MYTAIRTGQVAHARARAHREALYITETMISTTYAIIQATIALSSDEAEYYGLVKAASLSLGMQAMYADLGEIINLDLNTDASVARAIASRRGLGKLRHLAVHLLWLQQRVANKALSITKVKGEANPADMLTKYVIRDVMLRHLRAMKANFEEGRASECLELSNLLQPRSLVCRTESVSW